MTGSCLCGGVRYEITEDPAWAHNCHCSRCRKTRGAAFASNLFVAVEALRFLQGEGELQSYKPPDAERFTHVFCRRCGSTMPWRDATRGMAVVPMGSLDDEPALTPRANIFVASKAPWFTITDDLQQTAGPQGSLRPPLR